MSAAQGATQFSEPDHVREAFPGAGGRGIVHRMPQPGPNDDVRVLVRFDC